MKQLVLLPIILILFTVKVKSQDVDLNGKLKFKELELNCSVKSLKISRYRLVDKFGEYSEKLVETSAYSFDDKGRCLYLKRPSHNGLEELTFNYEGECLKGYKSGNQVLAECKCNSDGLVQTKNTLNRMNNFNYTYEYDSRGNIIKITSYGFGSVSSITINTYDNQNREVSSKVYNETGILIYTYGTEYTNTGSSISTFTDKNLGNGKSDREESTYKTFNKNGDITYWSSSFHKKDMGSTFYDYVYNSDNSIKTQTSHLETIKTNYTKVEYTKYDSKGNWIEKKVIDHYLGGNNEPTEDVEIFRREIKY
jgi:YD repeat-containing protein